MASAQNRKADSDLSKQIARLRKLGKLRDRSVPLVAGATKDENEKQVAKGNAPSGQPWRLTEDGRVPLVNAAKAVKVTTVGSVVLMQLDGVEARHHLGAVKGKKQRRIIPTRGIPGPLLKAIKRVVTGEFFSIMETKDAK